MKIEKIINGMYMENNLMIKAMANEFKKFAMAFLY